MASTLRVHPENFTEITRDLEAVKLGLGREIGKIRKRAADIAATRAKSFVPVTRYPQQRGYLAASLEGRNAGVVSTVPQGVVHEHGGTIAPRGHPIKIKRSSMAEKGGKSSVNQIEGVMKREIEDLIGRYL